MESADEAPKSQNSLYFSLLAGNFGVETGSHMTAHTTKLFKDLA
jgi:hypothetical protein